MAERRTPVTAPELLLKIVLTGTQNHYEIRGLIDEKRLEHLLHAGKQILYKSHQESDVRQNLGFSHNVWQGLTNVLRAAIPVLEQQSFSWKNPTEQTHNGSSSDLIAANYFHLVKDIERLNDLCTIARNLLATTRKAQNLAAEKAFDQQILKLIDVCVRVTARGFDGETNLRNEERWQKVVNLYKRLLITCLQFLHNFIMHNEHRKLVLWLDLFGTTSAAAQQAQQTEIEAVQEQIDLDRRLNAHAATKGGSDEDLLSKDEELSQQAGSEGEKLSDLEALSYNIDDIHTLFDLMSTEKSPDARTKEAAKLLMDKVRSDMERLSGLSAEQLDDDPEALLKVGAVLRGQLPLTGDTSMIDHARTATNSELTTTNEAVRPTPRLPDLKTYGNLTTQEQEIIEDDLVMPRTSQSAAETLQEAKDELMARLRDSAPVLDEDGEPFYEDEPDGEAALDSGVVESGEGSLDEDDEEDEDDYQNPGDQERGLLTDVPLVLGPTEIEALPMIIQAGIVDNFGTKNAAHLQGARNMQAVRCHILLAQEAGRNVLRELLIFIAAWDLPDDEFHFKMMVQIMEAILKNGLMSHAYSDFGQAKDIISPAQAVVIKILTHIFRAKYSPSSSNQSGNDQTSTKPRIPAPLSRVDVLTVRYIFTVFRGNIIPETCALIYLQGQIRSGLAMAEDFPLNLWDMERVYEGVYQFLEFFAVLTENNDWKTLLIDWEIVYDLVTLIKELDASIPKATLMQSMPAPGKSHKGDRLSSPAVLAANNTRAQSHKTSVSVSVERPYDSSTTSNSANHDAETPGKAMSPDTIPATQKGVARDSVPQSAADIADASTNSTTAPSTEDPSLFEWRNLKKLIVLVLSSLVWKSAIVQDQIREHQGVETILSCTQHDGHNPYIKEHAVMCLKFLLEGNRENQKIVSELEARGVANRDDIREQFGVDANVGLDGRLRVQRNQRQPPQHHRHTARDEHYHHQQQRVNPTIPSNGPVKGSMWPSLRTTHVNIGNITNVDDDIHDNATTSSVKRTTRRASDTATMVNKVDVGNAKTTAEKIANMTERFNNLDISSFAQGLPIRGSASGTLPGRVEEVLTDVDDLDETSDENGRTQPRVQDVGDMI